MWKCLNISAPQWHHTVSKLMREEGPYLEKRELEIIPLVQCNHCCSCISNFSVLCTEPVPHIAICLDLSGKHQASQQ